MTNFSDHYDREGQNPARAVSTFLTGLKCRGIYVSPRALPEMLTFNDSRGETRNSDIRQYAPHFEDANAFLEALIGFGLNVDCSNLLKSPSVRGAHLDHKRTLTHLREINPRITHLEEEARAYVAHVRANGVCLEGEELHNILPEEHTALLQDPLSASLLVSATLKHKPRLTRCKPGYSTIHPDHSRFRFGNLWIQDWGNVVEEILSKNSTRISDTVCPECIPEYQSILGL